MDTFVSNSLDPSIFQVEDVVSDNACFYRSIANNIGFMNSSNNLSLEYLKHNLGKLHYHQDVDSFYQHNDWGFEGDEQDNIAREIQQMAVDWISKRGNIRAPLPKDAPAITIAELVMMVHDISYDEYIETYQHYAGDLVITEDSDNDIEILEDRWGGYPEQLALSECLKIPIIVLSAQKYDSRLDKIITGRIYRNKPIKGVRFKIYQTSGLDYISKKNKMSPVIYLLWKKTKNGDHYMSLYPKDPKKCLSSIQNYLTEK